MSTATKPSRSEWAKCEALISEYRKLLEEQDGEIRRLAGALKEAAADLQTLQNCVGDPRWSEFAKEARTRARLLLNEEAEK